MAFAFSAFSVGMIAPSYFLDKRVVRQQAYLRKALPDAIDLLVVCTEAGLGLNAALIRTALALADFHPALAEELLLVNSEIRAGVDRNQALLNLAQRTGLDDIKSLVAVLGNSLRFGASVAHTLRIYSEEFRDKRMQKADEEAAKLSTKMIFPLAFCFMPGFFIVALGPTIVHIFALWPTLGR
jgi:tight adherence protein C